VYAFVSTRIPNRVGRLINPPAHPTVFFENKFILDAALKSNNEQPSPDVS